MQPLEVYYRRKPPPLNNLAAHILTPSLLLSRNTRVCPLSYFSGYIMQLEEFCSRLKAAHGDDTGVPDITMAPIDPEMIAAFIRCCGLNRDLDTDDAIDLETVLLNRQITEEVPPFLIFRWDAS
jgi:hypothetical protein